MLSWEYPPRIVGGIARHVEELAWALAARGHELHVVTCEFPGAPAEETYRGVTIHRVAPYEPAHDFFHWVHQLNAAMRDRAAALLEQWVRGRTPLKQRSSRTGIVLHAHDWLAHFSANDLKHRFRVPLVATIHATEHGRNHGIRTEGQHYINSVEWQLSFEAWRVIVCSWYMKDEVQYALRVPAEKIDIVPNGVHAEKLAFDFSPQEAVAFRAHYALPEERLIFFVGRMVSEKGVHVLLEALPRVRAQYYAAKLVIVGGGYKDHLVQYAQALGISPQVFFTGFIPDDVLLRLYKVIDVACYPSLYEPFGIVALEAMAAGVPVVVSDAGGLKEVVEHDVSGTVTAAGNPDSLAAGIVRVLKDPGHAQWMAQNAARRVREVFNWSRIAAQTGDIYERVWSEYRASDW